MISPEFIERQKKIIESDIERLEKEINKNEKISDPSHNPDDDASEFEQFEENQALIKAVKSDLIELEVAIKKISEGTYGACEICGEPIEEGRLKAYPAAAFCVTHVNTR